MKIGVISDTHDKVEVTQSAIKDLIERGAKALFHCGDLMSEEILLACAQLKPCYFVAGNNDPSSKDLQRWAKKLGLTFFEGGGIVDIEGRTLGITHGHHRATVKKLLSLNPHYLFIGHSHLRKDEQSGLTRIINPGALHRSSSKSYALIDLARDTVEILYVSPGIDSTTRRRL